MYGFDELVEATLISIQFNVLAKTVRFSFQTANTSLFEKTSFRFDVVATGVESFLGDTLREINIVDFVEVYSETSSRDKELVDDLIHLFQAGETALSPPRLKNQVEDIRSGKLILIKFVPVCGALFMVLAKEITVEKTGM